MRGRRATTRPWVASSSGRTLGTSAREWILRPSRIEVLALVVAWLSREPPSGRPDIMHSGRPVVLSAAGLGRARGSPATRDPAFPPTRPVERRAIGTPPSGFGSGRVSFSQNGGPRRCSCRVRTPGSRSTSSGESAGTGRQPGGWCSFGYAFAAGHHTTIAPAWQVVGHSPLGIAGAFHVACNDSESLDRRTRGGR
jgi:hypothetical protein